MFGKISVVCLCFALLAPGSLAAATDELYSAFATCTGRLAAQAEHERDQDAPNLQQTETLLGHFRDLLEATSANGDWRDSIGMRVRAKLAHRAILTRAAVSENPQDAAWAENRAQREIAQCRSLILGG